MMKRIEEYVQGERLAFYWPGESRVVNATVHEPHIPGGKCRAYLIATVTTPGLEGNKVLVEGHDLREPFDEPKPAVVLTADTVLAYASPDTLAGLIADCQRYAEWGDDTSETEAIDRCARKHLIANVGDEEAVRIIAEKVAAG